MKASRYQHLSAERVLDTLAKLEARIVARFPAAGLTRVCADLIETARFCARDAAALQRPSFLWRLWSLVLIVGGLAAQISVFRFLRVDSYELTAADLLQGLEAAVN